MAYILVRVFYKWKRVNVKKIKKEKGNKQINKKQIEPKKIVFAKRIGYLNLLLFSMHVLTSDFILENKDNFFCLS